MLYIYVCYIFKTQLPQILIILGLIQEQQTVEKLTKRQKYNQKRINSCENGWIKFYERMAKRTGWLSLEQTNLSNEYQMSRFVFQRVAVMRGPRSKRPNPCPTLSMNWLLCATWSNSSLRPSPSSMPNNLWRTSSRHHVSISQFRCLIFLPLRH